MPVQFINPAAIHTPTGYSHVAKAGNLVSIAGQLSIDKDGNVVGEGDIQAQTKQALSNLEEAIKASGGAKEDIAAIRVYMTNRDDLEGMRQAAPGFGRAHHRRAPCSSSADWCGQSFSSR